MRVAWNDSDDRVGLRGYVQFINIHTYMVRLDYATVICRLHCAMNWLRISRRSRRLFFPAVFCLKCSGHCTRALTFPRWGKRRDQWRAAMYCGE